VATDAAQLQALVDQVVPKDVGKWKMARDIQELRKQTQGLSRTLRHQKEVSYTQGATQQQGRPARRNMGYRL